MLRADLDRIYAALLRDDLPGPKEVMARVAAAVDDELVDRIDAAQDELGSSLRFAIMGDEAVTFAKVRGNPWDLHEVLCDLGAIADRFPLEITYEPEQEVDASALARWVAEHPRPAAGGFTGARIVHDGKTVVVDSPVAVPSAVDTVLRELVFRETPWSVEVTLDGPSPWRATVTSFAHKIALAYLLDALFPYEPSATETAPPIALPVLSEPLEHAPPTTRRMTRVIGEVAGEPVETETKLRLGRIKTWLHHRGEKSRVFINAKPIAVGVDRVVLGAERDGKAELLSIALPGFAETTLRTFAHDEYGISKLPRDLVVHAGRVISVWSDHEETRLLRDDDSLFARLPGGLELLDREGDVLYAFTNDLHRVSLADGSVRSAGTRSSERLQLLRHRGRWHAWAFDDAREIHVSDDAKVVRTFALPAGESLWTFDLSAHGTLAAVTAIDGRYTLHAMSADRTEQFGLDGEADVRFK